MMTPGERIRQHLDELVIRIADAHEAAHPELFARFPDVARARCLEDAHFHLQYLAAALDASSLPLFLDYVGWAKVVLLRRNVQERDLVEHLQITAEVLEDIPEAVGFLMAAIEQLPAMPDDVPPVLDPRAPLWSAASEYLTALLAGERSTAMKIVRDAIDGGASIRDIYRHVFEPVQHEIGRLWQLNRITVAQEHFCTAVTQQAMTMLYGQLFGGPKRERRAVAMCVGGELHEIGLRIIADLLELEGWQTWYLGANTPADAAVQLCADRRADALLVSATLPPHIQRVEEIVRLVRSRPELSGMKVIVGGRAFRTAPDVWRTIGADGYAADADECLALLDR